MKEKWKIDRHELMETERSKLNRKAKGLVEAFNDMLLHSQST